MNEMMINRCVVCAHTNEMKSKSFPVVCPNLQMPCMAIDSKYVLNEEEAEKMIQVAAKNKGRAPMEYIDQTFLKNMRDGYHTILKSGIDITKMPVY